MHHDTHSYHDSAGLLQCCIINLDALDGYHLAITQVQSLIDGSKVTATNAVSNLLIPPVIQSPGTDDQTYIFNHLLRGCIFKRQLPTFQVLLHGRFLLDQGLLPFR